MQPQKKLKHNSNKKTTMTATELSLAAACGDSSPGLTSVIYTPAAPCHWLRAASRAVGPLATFTALSCAVHGLGSPGQRYGMGTAQGLWAGALSRAAECSGEKVLGEKTRTGGT